MITSFTASNPSFALLPWMPLILLIKLVDHCFKHPRKKNEKEIGTGFHSNVSAPLLSFDFVAMNFGAFCHWDGHLATAMSLRSLGDSVGNWVARCFVGFCSWIVCFYRNYKCILLASRSLQERFYKTLQVQFRHSFPAIATVLQLFARTHVPKGCGVGMLW